MRKKPQRPSNVSPPIKSSKDNGNKCVDGKIGLPEDIRVVFSEENNPHDG